MSEREKQIAENLADAVSKLPDSKKEFLLGYAEGVAAMTERGREKEAQKGRASEADTNDRKED